MGAEYPLTLTVKALDKATGPMRVMTAKLQRITAPFRAFGKDFAKFSEAAGLAKIGGAFKSVGSSVAGVGREAAALGAKLFAIAGVAGFALFSVVHGAVEAGDKLGEMAGRVGLTVDAYASLQHAANLADVDQEAFNASLDQFNKRLGEAKAGGGPLLTFLQKVSPALAKQVKGATSTQAALLLMTDAFQKLDSPAKRAALSAAAFGKGSLQMGSFLAQGTDAIQKQQWEYLRLVGSQEEFARNSGILDNAMKETETAFLGLRVAALSGLMPAFTKLSKAVTEFIVKHRNGIAKWAKGAADAISAWVDGGGVTRVIAGLREFGAKVAWVYEKIGGFKGALVAAGLLMAGPLIVSILGVIPALVSLTIALAPLAVAIGIPLAGFVAFAAVVAGVAAAGALLWMNWDSVKTLFHGLWKASAGLNDVLLGLMTLDFKRVVTGWTAAIKGLKEALIPSVGLLRTVLDTFGGGGVGGVLGTAMGVGGALGADDSPGDMAARRRAEAVSAIRMQLGGATRPQGAGAAAAAAAAAGRGVVEVNFSNVPPGVSVSTQPNSSQPLDLSVSRGLSMQGG